MVTAAGQEVLVGGTGTRRRRRPAARAPRRAPGRRLATLAACTLTSLAALAGAGPAHADRTTVPGTMSTAAQSTSTFALPVPDGVQVRAVTGVVTEPEVVDGGTITFRVNGAVRTTVPSSLYQKVRIPVTPADVIADGTIGLTMTTEGPAQPGAVCVPTGGVASMRKIELDYRGAEVAPTTVADFFPAGSPGITVVIPEDADAQMITAGLSAVAALALRYDDDTPVTLSLAAPPAQDATAGQRVVALVPGQPGEVTTAVSTTAGIPMLTLTGSGDALVDAARALSTDVLGLSGSDAQNPSQQAKPRSTARTRTLDDLGVGPLALTGYGSVTQRFELRQDSFGVPVSSMDLHLEGSHTAFPADGGARLDVRANGDLVGSTTLGEEGTFSLDVEVPAGQLRSVNLVELTLNALAPDGSACTPPSVPAAEVDVDTTASTAEVTHGTGQAAGFQLYPQVFEGTLPVALRAAAGRQSAAAVNAAALVAELQRAAGSLLDIQLMPVDTFLADDRSGLIVGALSGDSEALDAPLKLSSTRLLDRENETVELTSQDPYAVLESIDRNDRLVLMLGSWAPGNKAAPGELARKVVDAVVSAGWENLDGDLVIADAANPAFVAASRSLAPHQAAEEEKSYAKWFVIAIAILLAALALQVARAIRNDRRISRRRDDDVHPAAEPTAGADPAGESQGLDPDADYRDDFPDQYRDEYRDQYGDDYRDDYRDDQPQDHSDDQSDDQPDDQPDDRPVDYPVDELGDVDDLQVNDYAVEPVPEPGPDDELDDATGELPAIDAAEYDEDEELHPASHEPQAQLPASAPDEDAWTDWDDWGDEPEEPEGPRSTR